VQVRHHHSGSTNNGADQVSPNISCVVTRFDAASTNQTARKAAWEPLLVEMRTLAQLLSISIATGWRWDSSGQLGPRGFKKGGKRLWRLSELREWVDSGMPPRKEWEALQAQRKSQIREK
jgi:predicted DNA-binding transcriptional regulator AlpA